MTARAAGGANARQASLRRTAVLRRLADADEARRRLEPAGPYVAYALAYLDRRLFPLAEFYQATAGDRPRPPAAPPPPRPAPALPPRRAPARRPRAGEPQPLAAADYAAHAAAARGLRPAVRPARRAPPHRGGRRRADPPLRQRGGRAALLRPPGAGWRLLRRPQPRPPGRRRRHAHLLARGGRRRPRQRGHPRGLPRFLLRPAPQCCRKQLPPLRSP